MKNRNISSPILCAVLLSLVVGPALASTPDASLPLPAKSTPAPVLPSASTVTVPGTAPVAATRPLTYTVVAGDSFTSISKKFNTTIKKLKKLNNLTAKTVKAGQVLQIPPATVAATPAVKPAKTVATAKTAAKPKATPAAKTTVAKAKPETGNKSYLQAQPVQDFDIPASTFASCPVPQPAPETDAEAQDAPPPLKVVKEKPAPTAKLVSPSELAADAKPAPEPAKTVASLETPAPDGLVSDATASTPAETPVVDNTFTKHSSKNFSYSSTETSVPSSSPETFTPPAAPKQTSHPSFLSSLFNTPSTPSNDWGAKFLQEAKALGDRGIEYDEDWRPPGESHSWAMDCSNTSRYLYKVTTGIQLPRTASDQYYYLHLQNKAWDVPQGADGWADTNFLRRNLKPGDLLFWENTYRPERQPPITHVMVFLGTNDKGQWIMAGSQSSRGGEHNRRNGGPDIYVFNPSKACGGYTTWLGLVHHQGRFCAYGRPLEADKSKLSVAAND